jgi:hypothetical protein
MGLVSKQQRAIMYPLPPPRRVYESGIRIHCNDYAQADAVWQMLLEQSAIREAECHMDGVGKVWTWARCAFDCSSVHATTVAVRTTLAPVP